MKSLAKHLFLLVALMALVNSLNAQVGIGTVRPNPNVVLDIKSANKGILLPRTDSTYSDVTMYDGSLVYDSVSNKFKYCADDKWISVNPLTTNENDDDITVNGNLNVVTNLNVNGSAVSAPNATITANTFVGNGTIPIGGIIMWSGDIANLPPNWKLCDGNTYNGQTTPDLRGRFIVGRSNTDGSNHGYTNTEKNNTEYLFSSSQKYGGNSHLPLSLDNLPTHQHEKGTLATSLAGLHRHTYDGFRNVGDGTKEQAKSRDEIPSDPTDWGGAEAGNHTHAITGLTNFAGGVYHPDSRVYDFSGTDIKYTCNASLLKEPGNADVCQCSEFIHGEPNPNYYDGNDDCIRVDYNPNYGNLISGVPEYWTVLPFDNRPAFYVLAFIMRVQ